MCRNPVLWPQGWSFCRDQSKSFWFSPRSTYWHIQMPSVYCENRSIGWNNTVTGDNVPGRDDLWSSFGFTDSGAFMWFPQQLQSLLHCGCHILLTPPTSNLCSFLFWFPAVSVLLLWAAFPLFSHSLHILISFPHSHPNNLHQIYPWQPYETPPFAPSLLLPALADCQCLRVSCRHFSFIILSKSGMALAQGDWVSVKHQGLIEFVLKWVIEGTLLMQSWGAHQVRRFRSFFPTCGC